MGASAQSTILWALALTLSACAGDGASDSQPGTSAPSHAASRRAPLAASSLGVLIASSLDHRGEPGPGRNPLALRAVFVVHSGVEREEVLDLLDLPPVLQRIGTERCELRRERAELPPGGWVDLLDAGAIDFESGARRYALEGQEFPGVLPEVSGLTYAGSARRTSSGFGGLFVRFEGAGSGEVGPFAAEAGVPAPIRLHAVGGRGSQSGSMEVEDQGDLELRWDRGGSLHEPLVIELGRSSYGARDTLRCVVQDDGLFVLPGSERERIPEHPAPFTDKLTVRRIAGSEFYASGVDEAWAFYVSEDFVILK